MIIATTDKIPGKEITEIIAIAKGSTVRSKNAIRDIGAGLKSIVGGELVDYTRLQSESREQAIQRMMKNAEELGADAVINVRMTTSVIVGGASEFLAYGTAVKLK